MQTSNGNGRRSMRKRTRILSLCAVLSALGVILLYFGSLFEVLDASMAMVASFGAILLVIECGGWYPWMIYGVTSILSFLLLPNKSPVILYVFFLGFYPILKERLEKIRVRPLRFLLKLVVFNLSALVVGVVLRAFGIPFEEEVTVGILLLMLNGVFVFYDYALSVMITAYLRVFRKRLRVERFFGENQ